MPQILFLSDSNGHDFDNPVAVLYEISQDVSDTFLYNLELMQIGENRMGGSAFELMQQLKTHNIVSQIVSYGHQSDYPKNLRTYKLIGNYMPVGTRDELKIN